MQFILPFFIIFMPSLALAYLDPATGAMIINGVVVAAVTVVVFLKHKIQWLLACLGFKKKPITKNSDNKTKLEEENAVNKSDKHTK